MLYNPALFAKLIVISTLLYVKSVDVTGQDVLVHDPDAFLRKLGDTTSEETYKMIILRDVICSEDPVTAAQTVDSVDDCHDARIANWLSKSFTYDASTKECTLYGQCVNTEAAATSQIGNMYLYRTHNAPRLGWSSWMAYYGDFTHDEGVEQATLMKSMGFYDIGYKTIHIDGTCRFLRPSHFKKDHKGITMTQNLDFAHWGAWIVLSSPIFISTRLGQCTDAVIELMLNTEILAINQEWSGDPGTVELIKYQSRKHYFLRKVVTTYNTTKEHMIFIDYASSKTSKEYDVDTPVSKYCTSGYDDIKTYWNRGGSNDYYRSNLRNASSAEFSDDSDSRSHGSPDEGPVSNAQTNKGAYGRGRDFVPNQLSNQKANQEADSTANSQTESRSFESERFR
ncbi:Hypothetical Protein FCC1311_112252 [Hondaea fermentalgiana]|uniref:Apple domain-containing protein n=1 Tax=Hondaea fermentalgiana TaxID=2315210 RepID=A0A2R5H1P1_9STRA|nr:Hypothetical Protein FCC1311_112252 [Hondaea fermentalgiana]|eukprot:GBG35003.1 Hypothetical Protein FCC1311_112252 [Hondaea fermentalgiana]